MEVYDPLNVQMPFKIINRDIQKIIFRCRVANSGRSKSRKSRIIFPTFCKEASRLQITLKKKSLNLLFTFRWLEINKGMLNCGFYNNIKTSLFQIQISKKKKILKK